MGAVSFLSGGLIDPGSSNYGKLAVGKERRRQALINLGMGQIGAVFEGGTAPFYSLATQKPFSKRDWLGRNREQNFYRINNRGQFSPYLPNSPSAPSGGLSGKGVETDININRGILGDPSGGMLAIKSIFGIGDDRPTRRDLINKGLRRGLLYNAPEEKTFEGFQPSFYDKRAQDYINFALPQVGQQYRENRDAQLYGLANRGLLGSSQATRAGEQLERTAGAARQTVADTGLDQANQLRRDVEAARQQSIGQLYQTADPAQGFQSAFKAAAGFQRPGVFAPITDMFSNLARQYYLNQTFNNYRQGGVGYPNNNYSLAGALGGPISYTA